MYFTTLLLSALFIISTPVLAIPTLGISLNETDSLKRILLELDATNPLIEEAQRRSDRQNLYRVNYPCLVTDLNLLKHGLRTAIYSVKHQPRQFQGLCGDYGYTGSLGGESNSLTLLINELQNLTPIIQEARQQVDPTSRKKMNYQTLIGDLDTIISGLQQALTGAGEQPRKFSVLPGGFSQ